MTAMITTKCNFCKIEFEARVADRNRGWALFCSKACKAKKQTRDTGIAGPHYEISGLTVLQHKSGKRTASQVKKGRSQFKKRRQLPAYITHDEYNDPKLCNCGEEATIFVHNGFGHNGYEGQCKHCQDDTHPFSDDAFS